MSTDLVRNDVGSQRFELWQYQTLALEETSTTFANVANDRGGRSSGDTSSGSSVESRRLTTGNNPPLSAGDAAKKPGKRDSDEISLDWQHASRTKSRSIEEPKPASALTSAFRDSSSGETSDSSSSRSRNNSVFLKLVEQAPALDAQPPAASSFFDQFVDVEEESNLGTSMESQALRQQMYQREQEAFRVTQLDDDKFVEMPAADLKKNCMTLEKSGRNNVLAPGQPGAVSTASAAGANPKEIVETINLDGAEFKSLVGSVGKVVLKKPVLLKVSAASKTGGSCGSNNSFNSSCRGTGDKQQQQQRSGKLGSSSSSNGCGGKAVVVEPTSINSKDIRKVDNSGANITNNNNKRPAPVSVMRTRSVSSEQAAAPLVSTSTDSGAGSACAAFEPTIPVREESMIFDLEMGDEF